MYTLNALSTGPYEGLFVALGAMVLVLSSVGAMFEEWGFIEWLLKLAVWMSLVLGVAWGLIDRPIPPVNTPVVAELMDDSWHLREKSGKKYVENGYLMYMTPEGPVSFKRNPGQIYPQRATLYKN